MQAQTNSITNSKFSSLEFEKKSYIQPGRRGEGISPQSSYLLQLNNLLHTARRLKLTRVIFALSSLIVRRGGVA